MQYHSRRQRFGDHSQALLGSDPDGAQGYEPFANPAPVPDEIVGVGVLRLECLQFLMDTQDEELPLLGPGGKPRGQWKHVLPTPFVCGRGHSLRASCFWMTARLGVRAPCKWGVPTTCILRCLRRQRLGAFAHRADHTHARTGRASITVRLRPKLLDAAGAEADEDAQLDIAGLGGRPLELSLSILRVAHIPPRLRRGVHVVCIWPSAVTLAPLPPPPPPAPADGGRQWHAVFDSIDADGSGSISFAELQDHVEATQGQSSGTD